MTDWTEDEITALMRGIASWSVMKRDAAIARAIAAEAREREIGEELDKATARAIAAEQMVAELRAMLTTGRDIVIETSSRHTQWVEDAYDTLQATAPRGST